MLQTSSTQTARRGRAFPNDGPSRADASRAVRKHQGVVPGDGSEAAPAKMMAWQRWSGHHAGHRSDTRGSVLALGFPWPSSEGRKPNDTGLQHRLMAILAADVAGYSRLMASDEHGTLDDLDAARQVFRRRIEQHFGRIVDTAGDSVLAVFETASGAVDAALAIQRQLAAERFDGREDRRMQFRIGIHLGDVITKPDGSVYGNGVNVTARLQALAPPGGISVSEAVHSTIGKRAACSFDDQGQHSVKNIAEPIRAYRLSANGADPPSGALIGREAGNKTSSNGPNDGPARMQLANFVLDRSTGTLRDLGGRALEMRPQAIALLTHLATNGGRTVGKDELLDTAWPGFAVIGNALAQAIGDARAELGAAGFDVIKTVPRCGYMLFAGATSAALQRPMVATVSLPAPPAAPFGRKADLAAIGALLVRYCVVTVIGAGGVKCARIRSRDARYSGGAKRGFARSCARARGAVRTCRSRAVLAEGCRLGLRVGAQSRQPARRAGLAYEDRAAARRATCGRRDGAVQHTCAFAEAATSRATARSGEPEHRSTCGRTLLVLSRASADEFRRRSHAPLRVARRVDLSRAG
jgi:class 3 adenylate cyclase/DNA-binding winged helix-turn-helix (wHTH) protein